MGSLAAQLRHGSLIIIIIIIITLIMIIIITNIIIIVIIIIIQAGLAPVSAPTAPYYYIMLHDRILYIVS